MTQKIKKNLESVLYPTETVIEAINHGDNNFVSTLDHLPCDLIRSLWFIQMMNLKNKRLETRLSDLYAENASTSDSENEKTERRKKRETEIRRLRSLILKNANEAECESKYATSILSNHLDILSDDRQIISVLKSKLPGWTSDAVEQRWKEWGEFKKDYVSKAHASQSTPGKNDDIFTEHNLLKYTNGETTKTPVKQQLNTDIKKPSVSTDLKIKLVLKPSSTPPKTTKTQKTTKPQIAERPNNSLPVVRISSKKSSIPAGNKTPNLKPEIPSVTDELANKPISVQPVKEVEPLYCFCNGPSFGRMVACEYEKCPHQWFHFKCVGLVTEPEGNWFCSKTCEEKYNLSKLRKKKKRRRW